MVGDTALGSSTAPGSSTARKNGGETGSAKGRKTSLRRRRKPFRQINPNTSNRRSKDSKKNIIDDDFNKGINSAAVHKRDDENPHLSDDQHQPQGNNNHGSFGSSTEDPAQNFVEDYSSLEDDSSAPSDLSVVVSIDEEEEEKDTPHVVFSEENLEIDQLLATIRRKEKENDEQAKQILDLQTTVRNLHVLVTEVEQERESLVETVDRLSSEKMKLTEQLALEEEACHFLSTTQAGRITELQQHSKKLSNEVASLNARKARESTTTSGDDAEEEYHTLITEDLEQERDSLLEQLETVTKEREAVADSFSAVLVRHTNLMEEKAKWEEERQSMRRKSDIALEELKARHEEELSGLNLQLNQQTEKIVNLEIDLDKERGKVVELSNRLREQLQDRPKPPNHQAYDEALNQRNRPKEEISEPQKLDETWPSISTRIAAFEEELASSKRQTTLHNEKNRLEITRLSSRYEERITMLEHAKADQEGLVAQLKLQVEEQSELVDQAKSMNEKLLMRLTKDFDARLARLKDEAMEAISKLHKALEAKHQRELKLDQEIGRLKEQLHVLSMQHDKIVTEMNKNHLDIVQTLQENQDQAAVTLRRVQEDLVLKAQLIPPLEAELAGVRDRLVASHQMEVMALKSAVEEKARILKMQEKEILSLTKESEEYQKAMITIRELETQLWKVQHASKSTEMEHRDHVTPILRGHSEERIREVSVSHSEERIREVSMSDTSSCLTFQTPNKEESPIPVWANELPVLNTRPVHSAKLSEVEGLLSHRAKTIEKLQSILTEALSENPNTAHDSLSTCIHHGGAFFGSFLGQLEDLRNELAEGDKTLGRMWNGIVRQSDEMNVIYQLRDAIIRDTTTLSALSGLLYQQSVSLDLVKTEMMRIKCDHEAVVETNQRTEQLGKESTGLSSVLEAGPALPPRANLEQRYCDEGPTDNARVDRNDDSSKSRNQDEVQRLKIQGLRQELASTALFRKRSKPDIFEELQSLHTMLDEKSNLVATLQEMLLCAVELLTCSDGSDDCNKGRGEKIASSENGNSEGINQNGHLSDKIYSVEVLQAKEVEETNENLTRLEKFDDMCYNEKLTQQEPTRELQLLKSDQCETRAGRDRHDSNREIDLLQRVSPEGMDEILSCDTGTDKALSTAENCESDPIRCCTKGQEFDEKLELVNVALEAQYIPAQLIIQEERSIRFAKTLAKIQSKTREQDAEKTDFKLRMVKLMEMTMKLDLTKEASTTVEKLPKNVRKERIHKDTLIANLEAENRFRTDKRFVVHGGNSPLSLDLTDVNQQTEYNDSHVRAREVIVSELETKRCQAAEDLDGKHRQLESEKQFRKECSECLQTTKLLAIDYAEKLSQTKRDFELMNNKLVDENRLLEERLKDARCIIEELNCAREQSRSERFKGIEMYSENCNEETEGQRAMDREKLNETLKSRNKDESHEINTLRNELASMKLLHDRSKSEFAEELHRLHADLAEKSKLIAKFRVTYLRESERSTCSDCNDNGIKNTGAKSLTSENGSCCGSGSIHQKGHLVVEADEKSDAVKTLEAKLVEQIKENLRLSEKCDEMFEKEKHTRQDHARELELLKLEYEVKAGRDQLNCNKEMESLRRSSLSRMDKVLDFHSGPDEVPATDQHYNMEQTCCYTEAQVLHEELERLNEALEAKSTKLIEQEACARRVSRNFEEMLAHLQRKVQERESENADLRLELEHNMVQMMEMTMKVDQANEAIAMVEKLASDVKSLDADRLSVREKMIDRDTLIAHLEAQNLKLQIEKRLFNQDGANSLVSVELAGFNQRNDCNDSHVRTLEMLVAELQTDLRQVTEGLDEKCRQLVIERQARKECSEDLQTTKLLANEYAAQLAQSKMNFVLMKNKLEDENRLLEKRLKDARSIVDELNCALEQSRKERFKEIGRQRDCLIALKSEILRLRAADKSKQALLKEKEEAILRLRGPSLSLEQEISSSTEPSTIVHEEVDALRPSEYQVNAEQRLRNQNAGDIELKIDDEQNDAEAWFINKNEAQNPAFCPTSDIGLCGRSSYSDATSNAQSDNVDDPLLPFLATEMGRRNAGLVSDHNDKEQEQNSKYALPDEGETHDPSKLETSEEPFQAPYAWTNGTDHKETSWPNPTPKTQSKEPSQADISKSTDFDGSEISKILLQELERDIHDDLSLSSDKEQMEPPDGKRKCGIQHVGGLNGDLRDEHSSRNTAFHESDPQGNEARSPEVREDVSRRADRRVPFFSFDEEVSFGEEVDSLLSPCRK